MKKGFSLLLLSFCVLNLANPASAIPIGGVEFPDGAVSFADAVVSYVPGTNVSSPYNNPNFALGTPDFSNATFDYSFVALGNQGSLTLEFVDNRLTTSGDSAFDLWIFEVGGATEEMNVWISANGTDFIFVGKVSGQPSGIDIDSYIGSGVQAGALYRYVKIGDLPPPQSVSPYAGADIDAVGAISSTAPVPEPASMLLFASGLAAWAGLRKRFKN